MTICRSDFQISGSPATWNLARSFEVRGSSALTGLGGETQAWWDWLAGSEYRVPGAKKKGEVIGYLPITLWAQNLCLPQSGHSDLGRMETDKWADSGARWAEGHAREARRKEHQFSTEEVKKGAGQSHAQPRLGWSAGPREPDVMCPDCTSHLGPGPQVHLMWIHLSGQ